MHDSFDAVVVGSGPNGIAAAIKLAQHDLSVLLVEANETLGGAARTQPLMRDDVKHDLGSAIHPMGLASPFLRSLPLERHGLEWIRPEMPIAHPLDGGQSVVQYQSLERTAAELAKDGDAYRSLFGPFAQHWEDLMDEILQPLLHLPRHPLVLAQFGLKALLPASTLGSWYFDDDAGRALFMGMAAHANHSLAAPLSSSIGLVLGMLSHAVGWPMPRGGAQAITDALVAHFEELGGEVRTGWRVETLEELPSAEAVILDLTPRQVLRVAGPVLPSAYARKMERFEYGPGAYKIDYIMSDPIPWASPECGRASTIHVGGTGAEIVAAEEKVHEGKLPERPFLLVAQPTVFDDTRAPDGIHTAWVYAHVPNGFAGDFTDRIEAQLERFAPGFKDCVLDRYVSKPGELERQNANLVGGDIGGGAMSPQQILARPVISVVPYRTPVDGLYICSASTPPGGGVHGMCGFHAARSVLRKLKG